MFITPYVCFVYVEISQTQNRNANYVDRKSHCKVTKLKSNFLLIVGQLNQALNNPARGSLLLGLA